MKNGRMPWLALLCRSFADDDQRLMAIGLHARQDEGRRISENNCYNNNLARDLSELMTGEFPIPLTSNRELGRPKWPGETARWIISIANQPHAIGD